MPEEKKMRTYDPEKQRKPKGKTITEKTTTGNCERCGCDITTRIKVQIILDNKIAIICVGCLSVFTVEPLAKLLKEKNIL